MWQAHPRASILCQHVTDVLSHSATIPSGPHPLLVCCGGGAVKSFQLGILVELHDVVVELPGNADPNLGWCKQACCQR